MLQPAKSTILPPAASCSPCSTVSRRAAADAGAAAAAAASSRARGTDATPLRAAPARPHRASPTASRTATVAIPPPAPSCPPGPELDGQEAPTQPPDHGTVRVVGDTDGVFLQRGSDNLLPGGVPAGTYKVVQVVSGAQPVSMGSVTVAAGAVTTIRCSARLKRCK